MCGGVPIARLPRMTPPARLVRSRGWAGIAGALLAALSLAGCAAGQTAQTSQPYNPADGRNVNVPADAAFNEDYVGIRNAVVVAAAEHGSLLVTIVNNSSNEETLEGVRIDDQAMDISREVTLQPGETAKAGFDSDLQISIDELSANPGDWVTVEFSFQNMGDTSVGVLVVPYGDEYVSDDSEAPLVIPTPEEGGAEVFEAEVPDEG